MRILDIPLEGSLQNPAWSPDGRAISLTVWKAGYNNGDADVVTYNLGTGEITTIATGGCNVSQPGRCWTSTGIVLSTDRFAGVDWPAIYDFHSLKPIPYKDGYMGYEPSWSPDNKHIAFERHFKGQEGNGRIVIYNLDDESFYDVTVSGDCRQPNYSPLNKLIWQKKLSGDEWMLQINGRDFQNGTDATFGSMDRVVYSDPDGRLIAGGEVVVEGVYAGAPSWKDNQIVFETSEEDPDGGSGTKIALIDV